MIDIAYSCDKCHRAVPAAQWSSHICEPPRELPVVKWELEPPLKAALLRVTKFLIEQAGNESDPNEEKRQRDAAILLVELREWITDES